MPDPTQFEALAQRCEQATGPDRMLDHAVFDAVATDRMRCAHANLRPDPLYTASVDAALTLVGESDVWGVSRQERNPNADYYYQASVMPFGPVRWGEAKAATAALALTAAALRARATRELDERAMEIA